MRCIVYVAVLIAGLACTVEASEGARTKHAGDRRVFPPALNLEAQAARVIALRAQLRLDRSAFAELLFEVARKSDPERQLGWKQATSTYDMLWTVETQSRSLQPLTIERLAPLTLDALAEASADYEGNWNAAISTPQARAALGRLWSEGMLAESVRMHRASLGDAPRDFEARLGRTRKLQLAYRANGIPPRRQKWPAHGLLDDFRFQREGLGLPFTTCRVPDEELAHPRQLLHEASGKTLAEKQAAFLGLDLKAYKRQVASELNYFGRNLFVAVMQTDFPLVQHVARIDYLRLSYCHWLAARPISEELRLARPTFELLALDLAAYGDVLTQRAPLRLRAAVLAQLRLLILESSPEVLSQRLAEWRSRGRIDVTTSQGMALIPLFPEPHVLSHRADLLPEMRERAEDSCTDTFSMPAL